MDPGGSPAIRGVGLTKQFKSGDADLVVFADLSFEVGAGERLALVGESGTGKSTLLYLLGGLDRPSSGKIYFRDTDICALPDSRLPVGSSASSTEGWPTNARASATRCCSPPDNSPARCVARLRNPTSSNLANDTGAASSVVIPRINSGIMTFSKAVNSGSRE